MEDTDSDFSQQNGVQNKKDMKTQGLRRIIAYLTLAFLFLTACQLTALETRNQPAEPTATAAQPLKADIGTTAAEPTRAVLQATPTGDGFELPHTGWMVPKGWQPFNNGAQGYSLAYPIIWAVSEETKYSRVFNEIQQEPAGVGPPLRLYVSVYPNEYANQNGGVYSFITSESIRAFMALPVGASRLKELDAVAPDYFLYTRLPDRKFAGQTALVIENSKVWEAPPGTKDRVVILVTASTTYVLGMYYETPQQLEMFEQVLDSIQSYP